MQILMFITFIRYFIFYFKKTYRFCGFRTISVHGNNYCYELVLCSLEICLRAVLFNIELFGILVLYYYIYKPDITFYRGICELVCLLSIKNHFSKSDHSWIVTPSSELFYAACIFTHFNLSLLTIALIV